MFTYKLRTIAVLTVSTLCLVAVGWLGWLSAVEPSATAQGEKSPPQQTAQRKLQTIAAQDSDALRSLAWTPDGRFVATVTDNYELVDGKGPDGKNTKLRRNPTSTLKLWNAATGKVERSLVQDKYTTISALAFSSQGDALALVARRRSFQMNTRDQLEIKLLDTKTWTVNQRVEDKSLAEMFHLTALAFTPDGKRLALGGNQGGYSVKLWDVKGRKLLGGTALRDLTAVNITQAQARPERDTAVSCLAFAPDGRTLAAGDQKNSVRLFDGLSAQARTVLDAHDGRVAGVAFAPDGKTLMSAGQDRTVKLWSLPAGELSRTLHGKGPLAAFSMSPDGAVVATAGNERGSYQAEVTLWDVATGKVKQTVADVNVHVFSVAFSPDGRTLAIAGVKDVGELRLIRVAP